MPENIDPSVQDPSQPSSVVPAAVGTLGALGTGAALYRALRQRRFSNDPALRRLQQAAQGQYTRVLPGTSAQRGAVGRFIDKYLATGGGRVVYQGDAQRAFDAAGKRQILPGAVHHSDRAFSNVVSGAGENLAANKGTRDIYDRIKNDKWREYQFFQRYAPGAMGRSQNLAQVMREIGYDKLPIDPKERLAFLNKLETHLKSKYGKGFLLKDTLSAETGGAFPTEKTNFSDLYQRYLKADPKAKAQQLIEEQGKGLDPTALKALKKRIRAQMTKEHADVYSGRVFEKMFADPTKAMVQEKLPLTEGSMFGKLFGKLTNRPATQEMRLHVVNGALVPSMTIPRFDPSMYITGRKQMRGAEEYARGLLAKMPKKYRSGTFAMDIAPLKGGGYGLIESNPSGVSGFYNPEKMPIIGPIMHKAFTGQHSRAVAGTLAAGGAGAAGVGAYQLGKGLQPQATTENPEESAAPYRPQTFQFKPPSPRYGG
jgi:hypothetical protein